MRINKCSFLYKLMFKYLFIERCVLKLVLRIEHGEKESKFIRKYYKERYKVEVGLYSYGCFAPTLNIGGSIKVGRYCSFAGGVKYFGANHPINRFSTSPFFYNKAFGFGVKDVERNELVVGDDVWIGYDSVITSSCHQIGRGAIIGAGSVVTHDVKPYSIVAGNPAKIIRMRFSDDEIELLEKTKWWEYEPRELMYLKERFDDIPSFFTGFFEKGNGL